MATLTDIASQRNTLALEGSEPITTNQLSLITGYRCSHRSVRTMMVAAAQSKRRTTL
jgi:hypothetical protein